MGIFSKFEGKMEDTFEGTANKMFDAPISPVQIAKKAEKQMRREKMVGAGKQYAPTLYTVLVNPDDDRRLFGYYPTLAGETETYLAAKASEQGLTMDGQPLVRFIVDEGLKRGKFDIIAENVSPAIIEELRREEMEHYGLDSRIDVNPVLRNSTSPAPDNYEASSADEFDPFLPADMQSAHYIPEDAPAPQPQPSAAEPEDSDNEPAEAAEPAAPGAEADESAAETVMFNKNTMSAGTRVCLYDFAKDRRYPLIGLRATLGRGTDNDIVISDPGTSRHHAEVVFNGDDWSVRDNNSTNGTFLNGEPVTQHILSNGDVIELGTTRLEFRED